MRIAKFEHRSEALLPHREFLRRVGSHGVIATVGMVLGLGIGVLGYHLLGGLSWVDSLVNASMILGGMGPVDVLPNSAAKVFASFYALFSGLFFIAMVGFVLAPFAHRMLHRFHLEDEPDR